MTRQQRVIAVQISLMGCVALGILLSSPHFSPKTRVDRYSVNIQSRVPQNQYRWVRPPQWTEVSPLGIRIAEFHIAGGGVVTLTEFTGRGGSWDANVNRWRSQLGLPPHREKLGGTTLRGHLVFRAITLKNPDTNQAIRVAESHQNNQWLFVKLTGPTALIQEQAAVFDQFLKSIQAVK